MSYSMIHDKRKDNIVLNEIENRKIYKWIDDSNVTKCYDCNLTFNFYYRKHHCRLCGRIFCYQCSEKHIEIPDELQIKPELPDNTHSNVLPKYIDNINSNKVNSVINSEVRVCNKCYDKMSELNKLKTVILVFDIMNFTIPELLVLKCVSKQWRQVSNYFLSRIREIQYYLSDHKYTIFDKKVLWANRHYIMGHSQWMIQLLKSIDYEDYTTTKNKLDEINVLITKSTGQRVLNCKRLMCTRQCNKKLVAEDCLNLLNRSIQSGIIKQYIIKYLDSANIIELTCYIPYFVHYMKYESVENSIIGNYFINKCAKYSEPIEQKIDSKKIIFINEFYWQMKLGLEDKLCSQIYKYFIDKLEDDVNKNVIKLIKSGNNLVSIFENIPQTLTENDIKMHIKKGISKITQLTIPINPIMNNIEIDISKIHVKNSATKPILLPLKYKLNNETYDYNILYKPEDVRKDKIVLNIIKLIDLILKREEKMDLHILTYGVRPINHKSGFIEFVPDCQTIYHIKEKMHFSISNYIFENNRDEPIHVVRDRFMKSCAAYCVITYLLGIGDRHLENIMVTKKGVLFHIDYGFILGFDSKMMTPHMRITEDMVDALGGSNSECYQEFKNTCNIVYNCLRRHINLFINMLSLLPEIEPMIDNKYPFSHKLIKNELLKRFIPGENNDIAELHLYNHIDSSSKDYKYILADFLHYCNQENVISSTINTGYGGAKSIINTVYSTIFSV
jgi:hypothetical protein